MKDLSYYKENVQSYVKHFFLEKYLERVGYNILSSADKFVYVDAFSGPWKSSGEKYEDTSFGIAIDRLRRIRDGIKAKRGKDVEIECIFNEKDTYAFEKLKEYCQSINDIYLKLENKNFEVLSQELPEKINRRFSLTFIDPTGWSGFAMEKIEPVLKLRGEVIINFMFEHINRFIEHPHQQIATTFAPLFGSDDWWADVTDLKNRGWKREDAILEVYKNALKRWGNFDYVTFTRIKNPTSDRSYFYLFYGTRHWKGVYEFRNVEQKTVNEQENIRDIAKKEKKKKKTGMEDMFFGEEDGRTSYLEAEKRESKERAYSELISMLKELETMRYSEIVGRLLEIPLLKPRDVTDMLADLRKQNAIEMPYLPYKRKKPKKFDDQHVTCNPKNMPK